jgi:hypothetical protein
LILDASMPSDIDRAFATLAEQRIGALLVGSDAFFAAQREQIVALAAHYAIAHLSWVGMPEASRSGPYSVTGQIFRMHFAWLASMSAACVSSLPIE